MSAPPITEGYAYPDLLPRVSHALRCGLSVFVRSSPGLGKSTMAHEIAETTLKLPMIDIRLAQKDPAEVGGVYIPNHETKTLQLYAPDWVQLACKAAHFVFLDEINAAVSKLHQAAAYQIVLEHRVGPFPFHPETVVMAAGNLEEDEALAVPMSSALQNRFVHFVLRCDADAWIRWAAGRGLSPDIIAYIGFAREKALYNRTGEYAYATPRCYDADTEAMTEQGWKRWESVTFSDRLATVNLRSLALEYHRPTKIYRSRYNGNMLHFSQGFAIDLMVTPNHNMIAARSRVGGARTEFWGDNKEWHFVTAQDLAEHVSKEKTNTYRFLKHCRWEGKTPDHVEMCVQYESRKSRSVLRVQSRPLLRLLGWYLSEGNLSKYTGNGNYQVRIRNTRDEYLEEIARAFTQMGFAPYRGRHAVVVCSKPLYLWLKEHAGEKATKHVPRSVMDWASDDLKMLLDAFIKGDGWTTKGSVRIAVGISERLADDLQELAVRLGLSANKGMRRSRLGTPVYQLTLMTSRYLEPKLYPNTVRVREIDYDGLVYCAEVPNHTLVVRRNGKVVICGNSWAMAARLDNMDLKDTERRQLIASCVGQAASQEFMTFTKVYRQVDVPAILQRGEIPSIDPRKDPGFVYALTFAVGHLLRSRGLPTAQIPNLYKLFEHPGFAPEFQMLLVKNIEGTKAFKVILDSPVFNPIKSRLVKLATSTLSELN